LGQQTDLPVGYAVDLGNVWGIPIPIAEFNEWLLSLYFLLFFTRFVNRLAQSDDR
jgi:hypothetical protein